MPEPRFWDSARTVLVLVLDGLTAMPPLIAQPRDRDGIYTVKAVHLALNNQTSLPLLSDLSGELLSLGFGVRFRAPGTSMHPTIRNGDLITVELVAPAELKRGDILLYRFRDGFIAHRLVNVEERNGCGLSLILRGDAATSCDQPVVPEQVLGKVVCLERDHRIIDPYSLRVRLWSMLYLWLARLKRSVFQRFLAQSAQTTHKA